MKLIQKKLQHLKKKPLNCERKSSRGCCLAVFFFCWFFFFGFRFVPNLVQTLFNSRFLENPVLTVKCRTSSVHISCACEEVDEEEDKEEEEIV